MKETAKREIKKDLVELSNIKYGLFNVDRWKIILADILTKKIESFNIDESNRPELKEKITGFLYEVIDEFELDYKESNRKKSWTGISYKNMIANVTGVFSSLKEQVPEIAESVLDFLDDPENREKIRQYLHGKLTEYADNTFSQIDYSDFNEILTEYGQTEQQSAITILKNKRDTFDQQSRPVSFVLFALVILIFAGVMLTKNFTKLTFLLLTFISFILLLMGLLLPMIEIDARISAMSFNLLGESVSFKDQVLYYKSKSILEIVQLMLTQQKIDLFGVGILVLLFSVLFPVTKLICSVILIFAGKEKHNRFVGFMVFRTGKWSMADVMVVAIFMAYIGFSGIISEQLRQLDGIASNLEILTTNESNLQLGSWFFTSFVLLSLKISFKMVKGMRMNKTFAEVKENK
ncbi:MAG: paraquat-inducible protein A [Bacteroidales bacterium]|nr:paraquat-inducible protein A [Bacteroidales bacterium]